MAQHKYYYYDEGQCTFVEVQPNRAVRIRQAILVASLSALLGGALFFGLQGVFGSPEVVALRSENEALREQLADARTRMDNFQDQLEQFSVVDQELYRTILQAEPISEDVRQAGVGGADVYQEFQRFGLDTRNVLRESAETLDKLERQMDVQSGSFRDLISLARARAERLSEMPAILPSGGRLVSGFGYRMHPIDHVPKMHHGIDLVVSRGTPVVASGNGVVSFTGRRGGYGITVEIKHRKAGYITRYAHLSRIPPTTRVGRRVEKGDLIAYSGNTGRSVAPHVHYEVRDAETGESLNPIDFFAPGMSPAEFERLKQEAEAAVSPMD